MGLARLAGVALGLALSSPGLAADRVQAFVDVGVIPMDREGVLLHQTVLVAGDRITALGPAAAVAVPPDAVRITGRGRYLLPGLTDAHVHLVSATELPLYLASGVTAVLNLHGQPAHLRWRAQVAEGSLAGPAIFSTGPTFDRPHTPEEAVRLVDDQAAAGYDGVKIYNQVGRAEYAALAAEAKKKGLLLMGHVAREPGFQATLEAGQSIAHAEELTYTFFNPQGDGDDFHIVYDQARIPEAVRLAAAAGVFVTPTLSMYRDIVRQATDLERYLANPHLASLPPWIRDGLGPRSNRYVNRYSPEVVRQLEVSLAFQRQLVKALHDGGVPLLTGTDATAIGPVAGFSLADELDELVKSGLSPFQALQAATVHPARYLRRPDAGTIAAGRRADLVLLSADPLADIGAVRQVEGVMVAGRYHDRPELARLVAALPAAYAGEVAAVSDLLRTDPAAAGRYLADHDPLGGLGAAALAAALDRDGLTPFLALLDRLHAAEASAAGEEAVNALGYRLLGEDRGRDAIAVFQWNARTFPRSANAEDSLAEAYAKAGDRPQALAHYRAALERDPGYPNAGLARAFVAAPSRP